MFEQIHEFSLPFNEDAPVYLSTYGRLDTLYCLKNGLTTDTYKFENYLPPYGDLTAVNTQTSIPAGGTNLDVKSKVTYGAWYAYNLGNMFSYTAVYTDEPTDLQAYENPIYDMAYGGGTVVITVIQPLTIRYEFFRIVFKSNTHEYHYITSQVYNRFTSADLAGMVPNTYGVNITGYFSSRKCSETVSIGSITLPLQSNAYRLTPLGATGATVPDPTRALPGVRMLGGFQTITLPGNIPYNITVQGGAGGSVYSTTPKLGGRPVRESFRYFNSYNLTLVCFVGQAAISTPAGSTVVSGGGGGGSFIGLQGVTGETQYNFSFIYDGVPFSSTGRILSHVGGGNGASDTGITVNANTVQQVSRNTTANPDNAIIRRGGSYQAFTQPTTLAIAPTSGSPLSMGGWAAATQLGAPAGLGGGAAPGAGSDTIGGGGGGYYGGFADYDTPTNGYAGTFTATVTNKSNITRAVAETGTNGFITIEPV